jgi:hypothetical protein
VSLTRIPKEDHIPTEQVAAIKKGWSCTCREVCSGTDSEVHPVTCRRRPTHTVLRTSHYTETTEIYKQRTAAIFYLHSHNPNANRSGGVIWFTQIEKCCHQTPNKRKQTQNTLSKRGKPTSHAVETRNVQCLTNGQKLNVTPTEIYTVSMYAVSGFAVSIDNINVPANLFT